MWYTVCMALSFPYFMLFWIWFKVLKKNLCPGHWIFSFRKQLHESFIHLFKKIAIIYLIFIYKQPFIFITILYKYFQQLLFHSFFSGFVTWSENTGTICKICRKCRYLSFILIFHFVYYCYHSVCELCVFIDIYAIVLVWKTKDNLRDWIHMIHLL